MPMPSRVARFRLARKPQELEKFDTSVVAATKAFSRAQRGPTFLVLL